MYKKIAIFVVALILVFEKDNIIDLISPAPDLPLNRDSNVILLSTTWCGYCAKTRRFFKKNDIPYKEYDVEKSAEGNRYYQSSGGGGVPIVHINNTIIRGYNPEKMLALLQE